MQAQPEVGVPKDPFAPDAMLPYSASIDNGMAELGVEGIHTCQSKVYSIVRVVWYTVFTVLFGFIMSVIWGIVAAFAECTGTYFCIPAMSTCNYCCGLVMPFFHTVFSPCTIITAKWCKACGSYWGSISIKLHNTQGPPGADVSGAEKDLLV